MNAFKSPVKIHPCNEGNDDRDNSKQELLLNKMTPNKNNAQRCFKSENIEMSKENEWIKNNFYMRVCKTFVPKVGDRCHCGYKKDVHPTPPGIQIPETWDKLKDTKTEPTNAYGEVEFPGVGQKIGRYVRVDYKTDMEKIIELITTQWKLQLPNLLISVTGGAKNFQMKPQLKEVFRRGLVKVAKSTGAWVTSAGLNAGVMKHVGEAIRDYGLALSGQKKVVCIGIAPWGCVQNKKVLINEKDDPAQYHIEKVSQKEVSPLDPNHSHFILVDDGTKNIFETEIEFRAELEKKISSMKISEDADVKIPVVVVMVEGGQGTLNTVKSSIDNKTPVIIVKGSGRAADIMAYAYQNAFKPEDECYNEGVFSDQVKKDLQEKISKVFENMDVEKKQKLFNFVRDSLKDPNLITVFEMGCKDSAGDIDMAVLKALLKANRNKMENLRLTLEWNRIDVAKSEIFSDEAQWPTGTLDNLMFSALLQNRVDFVKLFLEYGVSLKDFLTKVRLEKLYQETMKTILEKTLFDNTKNIDVKKVAEVINYLMSDDYFQYEYREENPTDSIPANDLFLWAVIKNREEMAFLFWQEGMEALPAALVANRLLKKMKQRSRDYDEKNKLQGHADLFEERAIGVLTECYATDEKMALQLLVQQRKNWGNTSCILTAVNADNKKFISQTACQTLLSNIWMGEMNKSNSKSRLIASIFCPFFIFLLITFDKKDQVGVGAENQEVIRSINDNSSENEAVDLTRKEKWLAFYTAPVIKFITNVIFYVIFLIIFSYVLMVEFQKNVSAMESLLYVWVFTMFIEELCQMYYRNCVKVIRHQVWAKYSSSIRIKIINYIKDIWNIVDVTNILLFTLGVVMRNLPDFDLDIARLILCCNLILFYFRVLHIFLVHKELGPKLVMIKKMVQDLGYFVAILFVFMVAYGIASQAILYPSTPFSTELLKGVFKKPYFQMYGELFLPEIEGEECNQNLVLNASNLLRKCPTQLGIKIVPLMMSIYILLTNILLLNLLIAMFSNTFQKIQANTDLHWHFQRFDLISEYNRRPPFPPPFILLYQIHLLFHIISRKCKAGKREDTAFKKKLLPKIEKQLIHWEEEMTECYLMKKKKFENNSMEGKVFITSDRTEQMMMKIEELQHQQQYICSAPNLSERLIQVENQIKQVKEMLLMSPVFR